MKKLIITLVLKTPIFSIKLAKTAENCDYNIDPTRSSQGFNLKDALEAENPSNILA
jgi:hypothetical protein